jgi:WD40 repeat protein
MLLRPFAFVVLAVTPIAAARAQNRAPASPLPAPKILGTPVRSFGGLPIGLFYSRDGALLLSSSMGHGAQVFDPHTGRRLCAMAGDGLAGDAYFCGSKQEHIAQVFKDDGVRLFDARTARQVGKVAGASGLSVSADGATIAAVKGEDLLLLDTAALKPLATIHVGGELQTTRFSADGKQVVVGTKGTGKGVLFGPDKTVDLAQKKVVAEAPGDMLLVPPVPLAGGKAELRRRAMNVQKVALPGGEVLGTCKLPILPTSLVALKDGAEVVAGDNDGVMVQVEFATGKVLRQWSEHRGVVSKLAVSPDGAQLVSMSWDRTIRFWNLADGKEQFGSPQHNNAVTAVAFAPDGRTFASGAFDNTSIRWSLDGKPMLRHA